MTGRGASPIVRPPMEQIANQREIVDRRALHARLEALAAEKQPARQRARVLEALREALEAGRAEIRRRFEAGRATAAPTVASICFLVDQLVRVAHDFADRHVCRVSNPTEGERLAIVAVGGYGRGELAPHSDVDLLFLHAYKPTPRNEQMVEYLLYLLWDLKLKVGHSTRSVEDCLRLAREDMTIRTALLESRFVWGDDRLYAELRKRFAREVTRGTGPEFVRAKLAERDERHRRMGDSRYVVEPNVKEGKGGLRDLHTLFWIAKYVHNADRPEDLVGKGVFTEREAATFAKAQDFLRSLRCWIHYLSGRAEDRLT
ncbi:MAG: nucleotidyltransferase domain-containing protein, partial [Alphaproteobacteria bacterium]